MQLKVTEGITALGSKHMSPSWLFWKSITLKPELGGVCSQAYYSVAYEETQSPRVSDFRDFVCSLYPKAILFYLYSRLLLTRIPRDSLKHFEISVPRNIRVAEVRKPINRTTLLTNECVIWLLKEIYWKYCGKEEKLLLRSNFSSFPQYFVTYS